MEILLKFLPLISFIIGGVISIIGCVFGLGKKFSKWEVIMNTYEEKIKALNERQNSLENTVNVKVEALTESVTTMNTNFSVLSTKLSDLIDVVGKLSDKVDKVQEKQWENNK